MRKTKTNLNKDFSPRARLFLDESRGGKQPRTPDHTHTHTHTPCSLLSPILLSSSSFTSSRMTGGEAGVAARCCWRAVRVLLVGLHSPIMCGDPHSSSHRAKNAENKQAGSTRHRIFYLTHLSANHRPRILFLHSFHQSDAFFTLVTHVVSR